MRTYDLDPRGPTISAGGTDMSIETTHGRDADASGARVEVADAPERERYEISLDGALAGFALYKLRPGLIAFIHTQIDEQFQGHGLADRLIAYALEDARARDLEVLPFCPFVKAFLERHREYVSLVPAKFRARFGL